MRAIKWFFAAALAGALASIVPASAKDFKIGYSVFWGTNPFLVTMVNGAKKAIGEWKAKGVNVDMIVTNGGDNDKAKQVSDLEDLTAEGQRRPDIPWRQRHGRRADQDDFQRAEHSRRHHRHRRPVGQVHQSDHHRQQEGRRIGWRVYGVKLFPRAAR